MSAQIDKSWTVFRSIENEDHDRCVDLFERADGTFGFEEFRRDVEDAGRWTPVQGYAAISYREHTSALAAAINAVSWLSTAVRATS